MTTPKRIQRKRERGWRMPADAIYVGRPSGWGNPFRIGEPYRFVDVDGELRIGVVRNATAAVVLFAAFLDARPDLRDQMQAELAGRDLACWCKPGDPCHADVLLELANGSQQ